MIVPPTPPISPSVKKIEPSGSEGTSPPTTSPMRGATRIASPVMTTNMIATSTFITRSKVSYRLSATKRKLVIPARTAQAGSGRMGNRAASGSAVALIAVAP